MLKIGNLYNWTDRILVMVCLSFTLLSHAKTNEIKISDDLVTEALRPKRIMLFVGLNHFSDSKFPDLEYPEKDVTDFTGFIQSYNRTPDDIVHVLRGPEATLAKVQSTLDTIEAQNQSELDIILVYLSTHGTLELSGQIPAQHQLQRFAVLHNTEVQHIRETGLSIDYLEKRLTRLRSQKKALILALCHSGSGKSTLPSAVNEELKSRKELVLAKPFHEVSSAMMVLSASSWGEPAREDKLLKNDIYTHFLLEGLQKNDANQDGAISLFEAHEYARAKTYDFTRGAQTPSALVNIKGMDPLILKGHVKLQGDPLIFADSEIWRHLTLKINGQSKGTLWQTKSAQDGYVRLALTDPQYPEQPLFDEVVLLKKNASYPVSQLLAHKTSWQTHIFLTTHPLNLQFDQISTYQNSALGVGASVREWFAWPLEWSLEFYRANHKTTKQVEFNQSPLEWNIDVVRLGMGYEVPLGPKVAALSHVAIEHLMASRHINNGSFYKQNQSLTLTYPAMTFEIRVNQLFESIYSGLGLTLFPWPKDLYQWDGKYQALNRVSWRWSLGTVL